MFELIGSRKRKSSCPLPDISHPAMRSLRSVSGVLKGRIKSERGLLAVSVDPDGQSVEAALTLAEKVMENIAALDDRGRGLVAASALDAYNSDWRFGERLNGGGIMEMFVKPLKSQAEFCASLTLSMVQVIGSEFVTLRFSSEEMFQRHHFSVSSSDGIDFNDVWIDLQIEAASFQLFGSRS